jgi:hypothetical protein
MTGHFFTIRQKKVPEMMMDCPLMISDRQEQPGIIVLRYCRVAVNKTYTSFGSLCGDILASQHRLEAFQAF